MSNYLFNRLGDGHNFEIVVMACSLGGIEAVSQILTSLPHDFPIPIVIVQHLSPHNPTMLDKILSKRTSLRVKMAEEDDSLKPSTIYIAPPNYHVFVKAKGFLSLSSAAKVNFVRPSADVLFTSVADVYQDKALGVVLTGRFSDGAAGTQAINGQGGRVISQDRQSAKAFGMPFAAAQTGMVNFVLPLDHIAAALISMVMVTGVLNWFGGSIPRMS
jgi:two-component system chemotaxis response regulator CheB